MSRFTDELADASLADLEEFERMEEERSRSTNEEMEKYVEEAIELLDEGYSRASVAKALKTKNGFSLRTAQRYVRAAMLELCDGNLAESELHSALGFDLHRLETMSDRLQNAGKIRDAASVVSQHAGIILKRISTRERFELQRTKWLA